MKKQSIPIVRFFIICFLFSGCAKNYLEVSEGQNFSKLYRASEDIEAVDFLIKSENAGFLILANAKPINSSEDNSNLILFNVDAQGYIIEQKEIITPFFDEGTALHQGSDDKVYILGRRNKKDMPVCSILIQTDINGSLSNYNDTIAYNEIREIGYKPNNTIISYIQNDFLIIGDILVMAGYIENTTNGTTSAIARSYSLNDLFQNYATEVAYKNQIPVDDVIDPSSDFTNSKFVQLKENELNNYDLNIYGVKENVNEDIDIINYIIQNVNDFRYQSPSLSLEGDQHLKAMLNSNVDNSIIYTGNTGTDSLFLIRGQYNADAAKDSVGFSVLGNNNFSHFGSQVIGLAQNKLGEVYIVTTLKDIVNNVLVNEVSFVLKFSFTVNGTAKGEANFSIAGNGSHSPVKMKYNEIEDNFYILSTVRFGTDETAVELSKVRF